MCAQEQRCVRWYESFPFVDDFEAVAMKAVSAEYLARVEVILESGIKVLVDLVQSGVVTPVTFRSLCFSVAALSRVRIALYYVEDILLDRYNSDEVCGTMCNDWEELKERDELVLVDYADEVGGIFSESICQVWVADSLSSRSTARVLFDRYAVSMSELRFVSLGTVLVQHDKGNLLRDMSQVDMCKPVLPMCAYRVLVAGVRKTGLGDLNTDRLASLFDDVSIQVSVDLGGIDRIIAESWLWLVMSSISQVSGYCYQDLFAPAVRFDKCVSLGVQPYVSELLWHLDSQALVWTSCRAVLTGTEVLHVQSPGVCDNDWLEQRATMQIGMLPFTLRPEKDYYAAALLDEFILKHKPLPQPVDPPLDGEFEMISLQADAGGGREFIDVAKVLYSAVDEVVSPRAEAGGLSGGAYVRGDDHISERDSDVVREVYERLADGPVISEDYFTRTYRRSRRFRRRPLLDSSEGRLIHVFEGFPADGGGGSGPWVIDRNWDIPGWRSYIADFDGASRTVSFTADSSCQDVRMDCTGEGAIELGDCKVHTSDTVLWFTNSVRFRITTKSIVTIRISVPDAACASAIGSEMRRYMQIPGYAVVVRSFSVLSGRADFDIPMVRLKGKNAAGCHVFAGQRHVERGRHRFKLGQLTSLAPARVLLKTEPPNALQYISVCGMRLHPRTRDHVSVLVDLRSVEWYVSVTEDVKMSVSMVQIVKVKEYDLSVASVREAKLARDRIVTD